MRSYISKSMMLGLALAAMTGCATSGDKAQTAGTGEVKANVTLPSGATISTVNYTLDCGPSSPVPNPGPYHVAGSWDVSHSNTITGVIGGIPAADSVCTLSLSASDGRGTTPTAQNCTGTVANVAATSITSIGITCADAGNPVNPGGVTSISAQTTITTNTGANHTCAGIASLTSSGALDVNVGYSVTLSGTSTDGTSPLSWSTTATGAISPNPTVGASVVVNCTAVGTVPVVLSVTDPFVGAAGATCSPSTLTTTITCSTPTVFGGGTGGSTSTGGAATGGAATGGAATGGAATGGSAPLTVNSIISAYIPGDALCNPAGAASCESTWPCTSAACLAVLQCIMPAGAGNTAKGSCFDDHSNDTQGTDTAVTCYCGTAGPSVCGATGFNGDLAANGPATCFDVETAGGMVPGDVTGGVGFTSTTLQAGIANGLANCLASSNGTDCFYNN